MDMIKLKKLIKSKVLKEYKTKINFDNPQNYIEIGNLTIIAKLVCNENTVVYEFVLDTQFCNSNELTHKEITMINEIMTILEEHKQLAISKLKKWTVEEYKEELYKKQIKSEQLINALKEAFLSKNKDEIRE